MLTAGAALEAPTAPAPGPSARAVMERAGSENFPVASLLLPRRERRHLLAIYGFARLVDELGDAGSGEELAALEWAEAELDRAFAGRAEHPLLVRLQPTLRECALPREPFVRLIEANRLDQRRRRYETWAELREYCALSADPVGELVLRVFGVATPERVALSDSVCTALQLAEHCQDVREDFCAGRIYLPREDMERAGCDERELAESFSGDLDRPLAAPVRALLELEVGRARELLANGVPLVRSLEGRPRVAVAAFVAGGAAALEAIERAGYDVRRGAPRASSLRRARALGAVYRAASR